MKRALSILCLIALAAAGVVSLLNAGQPVAFFRPRAAAVGGDPYFSSVVLLLHANGTNGSPAFVDSSSYARTSTTFGNLVQTTSVYKYGTASGVFDGSGDYLNSDGSTNFEFTGDFTIECWFRLTTLGDRTIYDSRSTYDTNRIAMRVHEINKVVFENPGVVITGTTTIAVNTWYHLAVSRTGASIKLFLDGVQEGSTYTASNTFTAASNMPSIGRNVPFGGGAYYGFLDDYRVTKGVGRYTGAFTPPPAQLPDN